MFKKRSDKFLNNSISLITLIILNLLGSVHVTASNQNLDEDLKLSLYSTQKNGNSSEKEINTQQYLTRAELSDNDFEKFNRYQEASLKGDPQAQVELGKLYLTRKAILKENEDPNKTAYGLFSTAAKQNHPEGFLRVAECLDKGIGIKQDKGKSYLYYREASKRYEKEAAKGNPQAQVELGNIYLTVKSIGGKDAEKKAYSLFLQAAEQNYLEGSYKVAECLDDGIGVEQNKQKAWYYFTKYYKLTHPGI